MALSTGHKDVSTLGTNFAPTVSSVARRVQYVDLEHAVQQAIWHVQETVRVATCLFAFLFRPYVLQAAQMP